MEGCSGKAAEEERVVESVRPAKAPSPESKFHGDCCSSSSCSYRVPVNRIPRANSW